MALFITVAMHEAMVYWHLEQHMTALQISVLAGCSERVVYEVLQLHRVYYGQFTNHFTRESQLGRPHILDNGDVEYIHTLFSS